MRVLHSPYQLSFHAQQMLERRNIKISWLEEVLFSPKVIEKDPTDSEVTRLYVKINENEDRVLRVLVNFNRKPPKIVSVHFDRRMRGKL